MAITPNRNYPLPDEANDIDQEFWTLMLSTIPMIDLDVQSLFNALGGKAAVNHDHGLGDITGLVDALAGKMPANATFSIEDLIDVTGADVAPDGYVLVKSGDQWIAMAASAAIGNHQHQMDDVLGLGTELADRYTKSQVDALLAAAIASIPAPDEWASQPIGVPIAVSDDLAGVAAPPTDKAYRYIKLTAADAYNSGVLTSETISGSAPLVSATAVVALAGSPLNGRTIRLINTERRFLRAGLAGTAQEDATQDWSGSVDIARASGGASTINNPLGAMEIQQNQGNRYQISGSGSGNADRLKISATSAGLRSGNETRPKNIGVTYYMRIK